MLQYQKPLCDLDDTWQDVLIEFKELFKGQPTWSCFCIDNMDKEAILSAPEIMDPKTDPGCGYRDISSLRHLLDTQAIPPASSLNSEKTLLDLMDYIHIKELAYFKGYSLVQSYLSFPYFFCLNLLKEECPVLYAYCRGVLRTTDCIMRVVFATNIRSEEEFMMIPPELIRQMECTLEEILAELEEAAAHAPSAAIAARLHWRKHFLMALNLFIEANSRGDLETACKLCEDALRLLESEAFQSAEGCEPQVDARLQRDKEAAFWVSVITPTPPLTHPPFAEAMQAYREILQQLASLKELLQFNSLHNVVDFVESFGARQSLLPVRCIAVVVLFSRGPTESFLYGPPLRQRLLEMLSKDYGSPLYQRVFEGDEAMVEGVVRYRIHRTTNPHKLTPDQFRGMCQHVTDAVRHWTAEAARHFLVHLETMLCNRGLAHRRLMNTISDLAQFQKLSYSTDVTFFMGLQLGMTSGLEAVHYSTVLTLFANSYVLRAMELVLQFHLELDLFMPGELVPALWYINFTQRAQSENFALLCLQDTSRIPETRVNKKTRVPLYNLALTTRVKGIPDSMRNNVLAVSHMLTDSVFIAASLMEAKGLIDLTSGAKHALVTVENTFNNRMFKCFGCICSPPFATYKRCISSKLDLSGKTTAEVAMYAKKAGEMACSAANKARGMLHSTSNSDMEGARLKALRSTLEGLEKAAKATAASLFSFSAICEDDEALRSYTACVERPSLPHLVSIGFHKKVTS